ncbi:MAG: class I SAM-dependent methyltransferase [bacterium]|nr:class I SAM-dependent methyltransferase [bacterium]
MKQYDASTALWNEVYTECELTDLTDTTLTVEPTFDACLNVFAKNSRRVLDFGCGTGDILFQCADFGYLEYGMGVDRSETGITYARQMAGLNHYRNLDYMVGDLSTFSQMEEESFDGIIVSNVLDVVPKDVEQEMLTELTRLLKTNGLLFVKINPYATEEELKAYGLTRFDEDLYEENGVLRLRNLHTKFWKNEFTKDYSIERYLEFPYPWQEGMNRLFLLKKKQVMENANPAPSVIWPFSA